MLERKEKTMEKVSMNKLEMARRAAKGGSGGTITPATSETLGGVKIGEGVNVAADGTISVPSYASPAYSTEEHKTGRKWIDGKDIYERTIELAITSLEDSSTIIATNIDYVDLLVDSNFTVQKSNVKGCERGCAYISAGNELKLHVIERWGDIVTSQITIQYTKTGE